jgi:xanthine/CO dehydrogenase XdhC/CoxF family maturation factor
MNEVRALINAFDDATVRGERCALATIVSVEGSSYRRPGARMLVREDGSTTGAISAGCLESDVVQHAMRVIKTGAAKLVEYNTASTSDEMAWGLGLGCNGIVRVLVEPLAFDSLYIEALRRSCTGRPGAAPVLVATVHQHTLSESAPASDLIETGARLLIDKNDDVSREKLSERVAAMLESEVRAHVPTRSGSRTYDVDGGVLKVFIETLLPPVHFVVFGAGQDALPIIALARDLGWQTELVDPQARTASVSRFAMADRVILSRPADVASHVSITSRTLTLLMSHNYSQDLALLRFLLASPARYIGVMGPRKRTERMLSELMANEDTHRRDESDPARLYSPAGLDIGANAAAEIAVSIIAEMRAVLDGRCGGMLRERRGSIHGRASDGAHATLIREQALTVAAA